MAKPIHVLNGPNLNLLGTREPDIYGSETLTDIEARLNERYSNVDQVFRQTNHEGELVDWIQDASRSAAVLLLNAGAYTHTSVAVHDALRACDCPVIEVHLSNPAAREAFRHQSYVAPVAHGTIAGFGAHGYELAMDAALRLIETHSGES
ncbi:MAG: type II 3-dehydroquinate dehydratase [Pseudomonadota bacterium]